MIYGSPPIHQRVRMRLYGLADEASPQVTRESRSAVGLEAIQDQTRALRDTFPRILPWFAGGPDGGGDVASVRPPPPVYALGAALLPAAEPERPSRPCIAADAEMLFQVNSDVGAIILLGQVATLRPAILLGIKPASLFHRLHHNTDMTAD